MKLNNYAVNGTKIDSVALKSLAVSRGIKVDKEIYRAFSADNRLKYKPAHL